jgi:hypothetical protein
MIAILQRKGKAGTRMMQIGADLHGLYFLYINDFPKAHPMFPLAYARFQIQHAKPANKPVF